MNSKIFSKSFLCLTFFLKFSYAMEQGFKDGDNNLDVLPKEILIEILSYLVATPPVNLLPQEREHVNQLVNFKIENLKNRAPKELLQEQATSIMNQSKCQENSFSFESFLRTSKKYYYDKALKAALGRKYTDLKKSYADITKEINTMHTKVTSYKKL